MIEFCVLGSGSRGNALLVRSRNTCVLIDCGFGVRELERRMTHRGMHPQDIEGIVVTHEHADHVGGVPRLARRHGITVHASAGTAKAARFDELRVEVLVAEQPVRIGDIDLLPVTVPHDAREPCQFIVSHGSRTLGMLTDLGCVTPLVRQHYTGCDALILECNHDRDMLMNGAYPWPLKQRVGGSYGHLSNTQAAELLASVRHDDLQHVVAAHLSEQNNAPALARAALGCVLNGHATRLHVAEQDSSSDWVRIE